MSAYMHDMLPYIQGVITKHPTGTEDYSIRGKFKVPIDFHVGSLGLAQATNATVSSVPPMVGGKRPCPCTSTLLSCPQTAETKQ